MKETHFFYAPDAEESCELPDEEATHVTRVLRMNCGDTIMLMDGKGHFYKAEITQASNKRCLYKIIEKTEQPKEWNAHLHLAMCPTKNMDRTEWFVEKATEIGIDEITFLCGKNSERKSIKLDRVNRIVVSAVKQSHKAYYPTIHDTTDFKDFIAERREGIKCICHCYEDADFNGYPAKQNLRKVMSEGGSATVLIGPEGDFSVDEVKMAMDNGYIPVSLGRARLRTETACLVAVELMNTFNQPD